MMPVAYVSLFRYYRCHHLSFADNMMMLFVNGNEQDVILNAALLMRISNWFYPALGILVILRYSIQGLGYSILV